MSAPRSCRQAAGSARSATIASRQSPAPGAAASRGAVRRRARAAQRPVAAACGSQPARARR
eukprot:362159-Chlamydomonas_euryale.AAC.24